MRENGTRMAVYERLVCFQTIFLSASPFFSCGCICLEQSPKCRSYNFHLTHNRQGDFDRKASARMITLISCMTVVAAAMLLSVTSSKRTLQSPIAKIKSRGIRSARGYIPPMRSYSSNLTPIVEQEDEGYESV